MPDSIREKAHDAFMLVMTAIAVTAAIGLAALMLAAAIMEPMR